MLSLHNKYRKKHRSPSLTLSGDLSKKAEEIALDILNMVDGDFHFGHFEDKGFSYNYLISKNPELPHPKNICKLWYSTSIRHEYDSIEKDPESGNPFLEI